MQYMFTRKSEFVRIVINVECRGFDPVEKFQLTVNVLLSANTGSDHNIRYFVAVNKIVK